MSFYPYADQEIKLDDITTTPFLYLNDNPNRIKNQSQLKEVLRGMDATCSFVGELFFSNENIILIQKQLVMAVFEKTNVKIPFQNNETLLIVMRRIFNENSLHQTSNYTEQIRDLNNITVNAILPDIIANINLQISYIKKITEPMEILEPPIHITSRKVLPSITSIINN
jgi:hypothetical protein